MAGKPQVTLTFAGDSTKLTQAFKDVGESARTMDTDVGKASKNVGTNAGGGFDKARESADELDTKAMGFRDTMTGVQDTSKGLSQIMKGDLFNGFLTLGMGVGDLASGMYNLLIPLGKTAILKSFAAGQWLINTAMAANPFLLVVLAVVALVAIFIIAYKKSETFRNIVQAAMRGIKAAFGWVVDKGKELVGWFKTLPGKISGYFKAVTTAGGKLVEWFKALPGKIGGFFSGLGSTISKPFTAAFQAIKDFWNNTIGGKGFSIPDWVPKIGGKSFTIPRFHTGGIVPGGLGSETLAVLKAGERVTGGSNSPTPLPSLGDIYVTVEMDGQQFDARIKSVVRDRDRDLKRTVKAG